MTTAEEIAEFRRTHRPAPYTPGPPTATSLMIAEFRRTHPR